MEKESLNGADAPQKEKSQRLDRFILALFCITLCLAVGCASFFAGYFVREKKMNEELRTLDWVITQIKQNYYEDFTANEIIDAATLGLETLLDRHSRYYSAEEYQAILHGNQGYKLGIGVTLGISSQGTAMAERVIMGSPAEECGILKGDILLGIRGTQESAFTVGETALQFDALLEQAPENVPFEILTVRDGEEIVRTVTKKEYVQVTTRYYTQTEISYLPQNAAYIRFDTFTGNAVSEFTAAMKRFKQEGKTALILDLRCNGGGKVKIAQEVAAHLVKAERGTTPLLMVARYQNRSESYYTEKSVYEDYGFTDIRVLCDENTASASELLLGAMMDYGSISLQDLYGERTYGKGVMQTTFESVLENYAIKLTTAKIYWPVSNVCIQDVGITPGNLASLKLDGVGYTFNNDVALVQAAESLSR